MNKANEGVGVESHGFNGTRGDCEAGERCSCPPGDTRRQAGGCCYWTPRPPDLLQDALTAIKNLRMLGDSITQGELEWIDGVQQRLQGEAPSSADAVLAEVAKWALAGHIGEMGVTVEAGEAIRAVAAGVPAAAADGCCRGTGTCSQQCEWGRTNGVPAVNAAQWPDARNRGLLQAAKQALRALEQHARLPWGQPEYPAPNPGAHFIYEAESYLRPAIEREEAFRSAIGAPEAVARGVAKPYAYEFGRSNGDGTYSVVIDRGSMVQVDTNRYEFGPPRDPHPDHPVKPLYEHPNTAGVTEDRK